MLDFVAAAVVLVTAPAGCQRRVESRPGGRYRDRRGDVAKRSPAAARAEAGEQAAASTGTGWATLRGQFVYDGTPPTMAPYNVTKEHNICAPGGQAPLQETLVVDSGRAASRTSPSSCAMRRACTIRRRPKTEPVVFDQKQCVFLTHVLPRLGRPDDQYQEQRSDRPQHEDRRASEHSTRRFPAGGAIPFKPQKEEPRRRRSRAASTRGWSPTCCRARTATSR